MSLNKYIYTIPEFLLLYINENYKSEKSKKITQLAGVFFYF